MEDRLKIDKVEHPSSVLTTSSLEAGKNYQFSLPVFGGHAINIIAEVGGHCHDASQTSYTARITLPNKTEIRGEYAYGGLYYGLPWISYKDNGTRMSYGGIILSITNCDEECLGTLLDSDIPMLWKSTRTEKPFWALINYGTYDDEKTTYPVSDQLIAEIGNYVGSLINVRICRKRDYSSSRYRKEDYKVMLDTIFETGCVNVEYSKEMIRKFEMVTTARYGTLEQVKQFENKFGFDEDFIDPVGNTLVHLSFFNPDREVFFYMIDLMPSKLNKQNLFGNTPLHSISRVSLNVIDWKRLWACPIQFWKKNSKRLTILEVMRYLTDAPIAFEVLVRNKEAWAEARRFHKRKILLTEVMLRYLMVNAPGDRNNAQPAANVWQTLKFFLEEGASLHHHNKQSLLNTALRYKHILITTELLALGAKLYDEDFETGFQTNDFDVVNILLKRPELDRLNPKSMTVCGVRAVVNGWTSVLRTLTKKGCKVDLKVNAQKNVQLVTANLVVQMNAKSIMSLKYLCVDTIVEANISTPFLLKKALSTYPEEIRCLFPRKEVWRWTLFMKDEKIQSKCLQLYHAVNNAKVRDGEKHESYIAARGFKIMEVKIGSFTFSALLCYQNFHIWIGDSTAKTPRYEMNITTKGYSDEYGSEYYDHLTEENKPVLEEILNATSWSMNDANVFLSIVYSGFEDQSHRPTALLCDTVWNSFVRRFHPIPKWYLDFMAKTYRTVPPPSKK